MLRRPATVDQLGTKGQVAASSTGGCLVSNVAKLETAASTTSVSELDDTCSHAVFQQVDLGFIL